MKLIVLLVILFCLCQCQKPKPKPKPPKSPTKGKGCPKGWIRHAHSQNCFYISDKMDTYDGASNFCKQKNAQLATTLTCEAHMDLIDVLSERREKCRKKKKTCDDFWIGIQNLTENSWKTSNGLELDQNRQCQHWAKSYPQLLKGTCGYISFKGTVKRGAWKNDDCTRLYNYVCITCPNGFDYLPVINECLYFNMERANWSDAREACPKMRRGAQLLTIKDAIKQEAVASYLPSQLEKKGSEACLLEQWSQGGKVIWMGGQTEAPLVCKTRYVWKPMNAPNVPFTYTNWFLGMPKCNRKGENCAILATSRQYNYKWRDIRCKFQLCSICEF